MKSHSIDGSAYESTQHHSIMEVVDNQLHTFFYELFKIHLQHNEFFNRNVPDLDCFLDTWHNDAMNHQNVLFTMLPGVNLQPFPEDVTQIFNKEIDPSDKAPWENWSYLRINGCTFSGDPYTTVRNTFACLVYGWTYLVVADPTILYPWSDPRCFVIASGDDMVLWYSDDITSTIRSLTT